MSSKTDKVEALKERYSNLVREYCELEEDLRLNNHECEEVLKELKDLGVDVSGL